MFDRLENGRALKVLALTDVYTREALALEVDTAASGDVVAAVLDRVENAAFPVMCAWTTAVNLSASGVQSLYVEKCAPWYNGSAESFNSSFCDECLTMINYRL